MSQTDALLYAFNRGVISPLALARTDLKIQALSAEIQTNFMCRDLGSMMLRPGLGYVDGIYNNLQPKHIDFIKALTDTAIVELTNNNMRIRVSEQIISRVAVSTAINNGNFSGNILGWTNSDESGAISQWSAGNFMSLQGNGSGSRAIESQAVTVAGGDLNKEHALRIVITKGYVTLRVGTVAGDDSYINDVTLSTGTYSLAFTPTGNFVIQVTANTAYMSLIQSINVESAGNMLLTTPWALADLPNVRWRQSEDEMFISCLGKPQYKIERIGNARSWAVLQYLADDGPFNLINSDKSILLNVAALNGDTTLASSIPFFKAGHVGCLFRLTSTSQNIADIIAGTNQATEVIEVSDVGTNRTFSFQITGTWVGTISLQRSLGSASGPWVDVIGYTSNQNSTYNDGLDNQIIYYRFNFESNYVSGSATVAMQYSGGGITGIGRITAYNNNQSVNIEVLKSFGSTGQTSLWSQGAWSLLDGYPSAVDFYEGRLWWFGNDRSDGSVSDAFSSFDDTLTGNSAPISRTIGSGPVENICWALGLQRLLLGGEGRELSVRSSYLDEPLTATDFNIKSPSTRGSARVAAQQIDTNAVFVQRGDPDNNNQSGPRLIQLSYQGNYAIVDYAGTDLSILAPEVTQIGIIQIAVQRKIDTRIHCLLADGTVAVCVYDPIESLKAWIPITTPGAGGFVEDILVMPGGVEDKVYYSVRRTINGQTVRYLEKWALESECVGGTLNKQADSFSIIQNGSPQTTISVPHLAGQNVCIWADGLDIGTVADASGNLSQQYTLDVSGNVTVPAYTNAVVGLSYTAQFQSAKLAYGAAPNGTALTVSKSIDQLGVILANTHSQGLRYGSDFSTLSPMPLIENGTTYTPGQIWTAYDNDSFEFDGIWDTDSRLCLQAQAPRPCNILAAVVNITTNDRK